MSVIAACSTSYCQAFSFPHTVLSTFLHIFELFIGILVRFSLFLWPISFLLKDKSIIGHPLIKNVRNDMVLCFLICCGVLRRIFLFMGLFTHYGFDEALLYTVLFALFAHWCISRKVLLIMLNTCKSVNFKKNVLSEFSFGTKCPICLERFIHSQWLIQPPCGHRYHPICMLKVFAEYNNCPVCRKKFIR